MSAVLLDEISERNRGGNDERVLSVTNSRGFVLPEDQFERRVASADLSNYKVVTRGQYAYNPSRINVGSIARLDDWKMGVLSPMYVVFGLDHAKVNSDYFLHRLISIRRENASRKARRAAYARQYRLLNSPPLPSHCPITSGRLQLPATSTRCARKFPLSALMLKS